MTEGNKSTMQKDPNNTVKSNRKNYYNRYKKNTSGVNSGSSKTETRNPSHNKTTATDKTDSNTIESTGGKINFNKNRNYKKKIYNNKRTRYSRNPADETVDEIKTDIRRIEKEIRLEIEEIKSLKV